MNLGANGRKNMEIKVFSEIDIQKFKTDKNHIVISIQDPNDDFVTLPDQESRKGWLGLHFYDMDKDTGQFPYSRFLFTTNHAKTILKFVEEYKNEVELICVNCVVGVSRSAGVAGALSRILNGDDTYFFKHYIPNSLVYSTILKEHFGEHVKIDIKEKRKLRKDITDKIKFTN